MFLLLLLSLAMIIIKLSAAKLPSAQKAAAARAGLPRTRENRATTPAGSQDKPRPRADKLPTIKTASYPQERRAKATENHAPNAQKRHAARLLQTQKRPLQPPKTAGSRRNFSIFRLDFFSI